MGTISNQTKQLAQSGDSISQFMWLNDELNELKAERNPIGFEAVQEFSMCSAF